MQVRLELRIPARLRDALHATSQVAKSRVSVERLTNRYQNCVLGINEDADRVGMEQSLHNAHIDAQIGNLYARVFYREWRTSRKSTRIDREPCARADELLTHMSRVLPVDDLGMGWDIDERPVGIPVWRMSVPFDEGWTDPQALASRSTSELVMACLLGVYGSDDVQTYLSDVRQFSYAFPESCEGIVVDAAALRRACRKQKGGLWRNLTDAIWVVGHSTGNFMLDYDDDTAQYFWERVEDLGWTVNGYRRLKKEYNQAVKLLKLLSDVCAWLDREPHHWPEVFRLWTSSHRRYTGLRQRRRSG